MAAREWVRSVWSRGQAQLRRSSLERDLDDELRFHLAMREQRYGAAGRGAEEARHAALRRFGNPVALKEECRDMWSFKSLETLGQDVRFAGRVLAKSPGFTATAVLSIALGIGGNAAMFSLVSAILVRPLPYPAADRVVVSRATATRYWPDENPIGKRIRVVWDADWRTVVGVGGDVRQYTLSGQAPAEIAGAFYMPYPQAVALDRQLPRSMALFVRSSGDATALGSRVRDLVASVNPDVPVSAVQSLDAVVSSSVAEPRAMMWLFAAFAGCALLLAAIGTYGVVSYATAQRTYEIGVRVAIGATRGDIFGLVIGQSLRLVLAGLAIGVGAALLLGQTLSSFLYGVSPSDPVTFAVVVALLVLTALLAGYIPGRRAVATDPVRALRTD
jgi:hypothetical protein